MSRLIFQDRISHQAAKPEGVESSFNVAPDFSRPYLTSGEAGGGESSFNVAPDFSRPYLTSGGEAGGNDGTRRQIR